MLLEAGRHAGGTAEPCAAAWRCCRAYTTHFGPGVQGGSWPIMLLQQPGWRCTPSRPPGRSPWLRSGAYSLSGATAPVALRRRALALQHAWRCGSEVVKNSAIPS